jgi:hypothetical protein
VEQQFPLLGYRVPLLCSDAGIPLCGVGGFVSVEVVAEFFCALVVVDLLRYRDFDGGMKLLTGRSVLI